MKILYLIPAGLLLLLFFIPPAWLDVISILSVAVDMTRRFFAWIGVGAEGNFQKGMEAKQAGKHAKAVKLLSKAAEREHADAQYELGWYYYNGKSGSITKNYEDAIRLWCKAAEQGHIKAQCMLGMVYSEDEGRVNKNEEEAYMWFLLAVANENEDETFKHIARQGIDKLESRLSRDKIAAVQARAQKMQTEIDKNMGR